MFERPSLQSIGSLSMIVRVMPEIRDELLLQNLTDNFSLEFQASFKSYQLKRETGREMQTNEFSFQKRHWKIFTIFLYCHLKKLSNFLHLLYFSILGYQTIYFRHICDICLGITCDSISNMTERRSNNQAFKKFFVIFDLVVWSVHLTI